MAGGPVELFRSRGPVDRALRSLADSPALTIVVGAGASVESGLPDWSELVRRLLRSAGERQRLQGDQLEAFVKWTTEREGLLASASIVRALFDSPSDFNRALRAALYATDQVFLPGETATAVARLRLNWSAARDVGASELVTTNYDTLLEEAIEGQLSRRPELRNERSVRRRTDEAPQAVTEVVVRHLHGAVPIGRRTEGDVILSEADYHLMQDLRSWQEGWFAERLRGSSCVFVASGLTDPNLLRYLYRAGGGGPHVACFARQQDAARYRSADPSVVGAREATIAARWNAVAVTPVLVDHYSQTAQFVSELDRLRSLGGAYVDLPTRLLDWQARTARGPLNSEPALFSDRQDRLCTLLGTLVESAEELLAGAEQGPTGVLLRSGERLHGSLWAYQPDSDSLVNWASSDRAWRDPDTLQPVPVDANSDFAAVRAFCNGSLVEHDTTGQVATRWNHVIGAPLYLDDEEFGRLPVGALTLASTEPPPESALHRGSASCETPSSRSSRNDSSRCFDRPPNEADSCHRFPVW